MVLQNSLIHTEEVKFRKTPYFEQTIRSEQAVVGKEVTPVNCNSFKSLTMDYSDLVNTDNCGKQQV